MVAAGCVTTHRPSAQDPSTPELAALHFEAAVFGNDFSDAEDILRKWPAESELRLWLYDDAGDVADRSRDDVARLVAALTPLTVLSARLVEQPPDANFAVAWAERRRFRTIMRATGRVPAAMESNAWLDGNACIGTQHGPPGTGELDGAIVIVGTDIPLRRQQHCLLEELYQVLGPAADTCVIRPSVVCEADTVFELQPIDRLVLRTLYDSRLKPGMTKAEAMPIAREIIKELWAE